VAAAMSGDLALAASALQELRRIQPNISLEWIANQLPWRFDGDREHYWKAFAVRVWTRTWQFRSRGGYAVEGK